MKTDKEYPATHSMSTAWFGIDKDGKVAILDFNDNGPVPCQDGAYQHLDECYSDQIITDILTSKNSDGMPDARYTLEQAKELERIMSTPTDVTDLYSTMLVKIDRSRKDRFLDLCVENAKSSNDYPYCVICEEAGLYITDFYYWRNKDVSELIEERIVLSYKMFCMYHDDHWNENEQRDVFEPDMHNFPLYLYQQPYSPHQPMERTYTPKFPVSESQIAEEARVRALRFPFSFDNMPKLQIAEFLDYSCSYFVEEIEVGEHIFPAHPLPLSDGTEGHVTDYITGSWNCKRCRKCFLPEHKGVKQFRTLQFTRYPTVAVLYAPLDFPIENDGRRYNFDECLESEGSTNCQWLNVPYKIKNQIYIPIIAGIPVRDDGPCSMRCLWADMVKQQEKNGDITRWFANCKDKLEQSVTAVNPHAIILTKRAFRLMSESYDLRDGKLRISGSAYPFFVINRLKDSLDEIERLSKLPYRGKTSPRVFRNI